MVKRIVFCLIVLVQFSCGITKPRNEEMHNTSSLISFDGVYICQDSISKGHSFLYFYRNGTVYISSISQEPINTVNEGSTCLQIPSDNRGHAWEWGHFSILNNKIEIVKSVPKKNTQGIHDMETLKANVNSASEFVIYEKLLPESLGSVILSLNYKYQLFQCKDKPDSVNWVLRPRK